MMNDGQLEGKGYSIPCSCAVPVPQQFLSKNVGTALPTENKIKAGPVPLSSNLNFLANPEHIYI